MGEDTGGTLRRHFGLLQATALNVTMIVGVGVFVTIPDILHKLPGPYALLAWLGAGALILVDGLIWSELGGALPGSGGSYLFLLECYGRERWGRLMAFLFIWQFLLSGPLEIASGLIAMDTLGQSLLSPEVRGFNEAWTWKWVLWESQELSLTFSPARLVCVAVGLVLLVLLYRSITGLGRLTVTFSIGILVAMLWILVEGGLRFHPQQVFDLTGAEVSSRDLLPNLAAAMILAMYSYLGYYNVCYIGDEVRDPGRTIPRAILLSTALVVVLFTGLHLAMLGVVPWNKVAVDHELLKDQYSLPAQFMGEIYGHWAVVLITLLILWSALGSAFAGLLGYSRIPFGAARQGHFFAGFARVHPRHHIPHISLLFVGGVTLLCSFFDLANVINALITTRILQQFIGQIVGVVLLRRSQPDRPRPFRIWLYPLPCGLALAGWLYLFVASQTLYLLLSLFVLASGYAAFLLWSWRTAKWPFAKLA